LALFQAGGQALKSEIKTKTSEAFLSEREETAGQGG
jgi:hypothetical protein